MKATLNQRLSLCAILPTTGNEIALRILKDVRKKVGVTDKERKAFEIKNTTQGITWNVKKTPKDFEMKFTKMELDQLTILAHKLNAEEKLNYALLEFFTEAKIAIK